MSDVYGAIDQVYQSSGKTMTLPNPWLVYYFDMVLIQKDIITRADTDTFNYITDKIQKFDVAKEKPNVDPELYRQQIPNMAIAILKASKVPGANIDALISNHLWVMGTGDAMWKWGKSRKEDIPHPWSDMVPFDNWIIQKP